MMEVKRIESKQPKMTDVEIHVAYSDKCNFEFNGRYKFRAMGPVVFNGLTVPAGYYQGVGKVHLVPKKGTHVLFERFPLQRPKRRAPIPVPDIISEITIEEQIARAVRAATSRSNESFDESDLSFDDFDEESLDYVSDAYTVDFTEEHQDIPPDSPEGPQNDGDPEQDAAGTTDHGAESEPNPQNATEPSSQ